MRTTYRLKESDKRRSHLT